MKISFLRDRSILNKILFMVYKVSQAFNVGVYFYFYPVLVIFLQLTLPYMLASYRVEESNL